MCKIDTGLNRSFLSAIFSQWMLNFTGGFFCYGRYLPNLSIHASIIQAAIGHGVTSAEYHLLHFHMHSIPAYMQPPGEQPLLHMAAYRVGPFLCLAALESWAATLNCVTPTPPHSLELASPNRVHVRTEEPHVPEPPYSPAPPVAIAAPSTTLPYLPRHSSCRLHFGILPVKVTDRYMHPGTFDSHVRPVGDRNSRTKYLPI